MLFMRATDDTLSNCWKSDSSNQIQDMRGSIVVYETVTGVTHINCKTQFMSQSNRFYSV